MNANNTALGSDLAKSDAHVIAPNEYDELPEITEADIKGGTWMIGRREVSEADGRAAFRKMLKSRKSISRSTLMFCSFTEIRRADAVARR